MYDYKINFKDLNKLDMKINILKWICINSTSHQEYGKEISNEWLEPVSDEEYKKLG